MSASETVRKISRYVSFWLCVATKCTVCQKIRNFTFRCMNSKYGFGHLAVNLLHSFKLSVNQSDDIMQITLSYFVTPAIIQLYHGLTKKFFPPLFKITNGFAANLWLQSRSVAFSITCVCIELISTVVHFTLEQTKFKKKRKQRKKKKRNQNSRPIITLASDEGGEQSFDCFLILGEI